MATKITPVRESTNRAFEEFEQWYRSRLFDVDVSTGFANLDRTLGGWLRGRFAVVGGDPFGSRPGFLRRPARARDLERCHDAYALGTASAEVVTRSTNCARPPESR